MTGDDVTNGSADVVTLRARQAVTPDDARAAKVIAGAIVDIIERSMEDQKLAAAKLSERVEALERRMPPELVGRDDDPPHRAR